MRNSPARRQMYSATVIISMDPHTDCMRTESEEPVTRAGKRKVSSRFSDEECTKDAEQDCRPPKRCTPRPKISSPSASLSQRFLDLEQQMCQELSLIRFSSPVTHIYNPLDYATETHHCYVHSYVDSTKRVMFFGMNPGPFGMAQTGVPFCDPSIATGWLKISGSVRKPPEEHPKRPILGLSSTRHEVSGSRFWGLFQDLCGEPETFFTNCFVHNYCPLCFMGSSGKNITPPELKVGERNSLQEVCDRYLQLAVELLGVEWLIGVGKYAETRARKALKNCNRDVHIASITHPSPINPAANKDWKGLATSQLTALGLLDLICGKSEKRPEL